MVFQHGIGWLAVMALPMTLLGIGTMFSGVDCGVSEKETIRNSLIMVQFELGTFLDLLGLTFFRLRKVIDLRQPTVIDRWSVLWVSRTKQYRLEESHAVGVVHGAVSSSSATCDRYKVNLVAHSAGRSALAAYGTVGRGIQNCNRESGPQWYV